MGGGANSVIEGHLLESAENPAKLVSKQRNQSKHKFLCKAMCCNLQHFSQIRLQIKELSLSDDAISCVLSDIESDENRVNTDAFATCENVQIQTQQTPTPPRFSAVEVYEML